MNHREKQIRQIAVKALANSNDPRSVKPLISALKRQDDSSIRCAAAYGLGRLKAKEAVEPLIEAWESATTNDLLDATAHALGEIDPEWRENELCRKHVDDLILALKHESSDVRKRAVKSLGEIKCKQAFDALIDVWKTDSDVRQEAARALNSIDRNWGESPLVSEAVADFILALEHDDKKLRVEAARALGQAKPKQAVEALIRALRDADWQVRREAASALADCSDSRAVEPLVQLLNELLNSNHPNEEEDDLRKEVVGALGWIEDPRAIQPLAKLLRLNYQALEDAPAELRRLHAVYEAVDALAHIRDSRATDLLIGLVNDDDPVVRREVIGKSYYWALWAKGDDMAKKLIAALERELPRVGEEPLIRNRLERTLEETRERLRSRP